MKADGIVIWECHMADEILHCLIAAQSLYVWKYYVIVYAVEIEIKMYWF